MKETQLVNLIIDYYKYHSRLVRLWRNNSGMITVTGKDKKTRRIRLAPIGSPDIIGYCKPDGKFIGIECKIGTNTPSDPQEAFLQDIEDKNAIKILAYSLEDAQAVLNPILGVSV